MSKTRWFFLLLLLFAMGGGAVYYFKNKGAFSKTTPVQNDTSRAVPVLLAQATTRDVPIWLNGIGTVQAYNTVTVRPRVSGTLDSVNFTEGQQVEKGEILAQIDPRPYQAIFSQARAKKNQDEAQLANARRELSRTRALVESDAESQRILDQHQATVAQLEALVQADQAALDAAQLDLDFTTLRAPIAGRTGVRRLDAGNTVTANQGEGLVVVTQVQPISVVFTLPQRHLAALRPHMQAGSPDLIVQAIDDTGALLGTGKLELIDNQIDNSTGTIRLKATFPNDDTALWPGQFVNTRVLIETRKNAVVVPASAVQNGIDGPFVYLARPDHTVEMRPVQPGPEIDSFTVIEKGLQPGDSIVREGQNKLKPGAHIAPTEAKR